MQIIIILEKTAVLKGINSMNKEYDAICTKVESLIGRMTLEEKIGQMNYIDCTLADPTNAIRAGQVGLLANVKDAANANQLQRIAVEESRLGIPLFIGNDVIHGFRTIFPIPLAEAGSWDETLMEETAAIAAREAIAAGTQLIYGPMVDISREPRWGRIAESSGEDPYLGSVVAKAKIRGFQRNDWDDHAKVAACAKHFIAYGEVEGGRDYNTADLSPQKLRELYLPPFQAAIAAGVKHVMAAFNDPGGLPMAANRALITDLLKEELGFDGFVASDYNAIAELISHGVAANRVEACEQAVLAGIDMDMNSGVFLEHLPDLIRRGKIPLGCVDEAVRRILTVKFWANLFDFPYSNPKDEASVLFCKEHTDAALEAARRSIVLLKNEGGLLPLNKCLRSLAVIGPLAESKDLLGCWPCYGQYEEVLTVLAGIRQAVGPETTVRYAKGCTIDPEFAAYYLRENPELETRVNTDASLRWLHDEEDKEGLAEAVEAAKNSDAAIVVVGEASLMSGEARCRATLDLPGKQLELVKAVQATGTPTVVVLMNGRPLAVTWIEQHIPALLETWFLGTRTGDAIADVLFGKYNPSGKLPVTFPRATGQIPIYYNHKKTGRPDGCQPFYVSRYLDLPSEPLFPFGYGLSYTKFEYRNLTLSSENLRFSETLEIAVTVQNVGDRFGEEVVQLYIGDVTAGLARPVKELKGFQKIPLRPGEARRVLFKINSSVLGYYDRSLRYITEPGLFKVWVGPNSATGLETQFTLLTSEG
ncbi:MAG TPA: beta-glucosidase BglX [Bacillota bacterium]|nr:beta-glucosidase BglX [Bacillota bacterium]